MGAYGMALTISTGVTSSRIVAESRPAAQARRQARWSAFGRSICV